MALPAHLQASLTPAEVVFAAGMERVRVLPRARMARLRLVEGEIPELVPPHKAELPLWLALMLKRQRKVQIEAPAWLQVGALESELAAEEEYEGLSDNLPYYWLEIANALLEQAADDVPESDRVRSLIRDILEVRRSKMRQGLAEVNIDYLQVDNIGAAELNELRPILRATMSKLQGIAAAGSGEAGASDAEQDQNRGDDDDDNDSTV